MTELWRQRLDLDFSGKSKLSKNVYATLIRKFKPKDYSKWEVLKFLQDLREKEHCSPNYCRMAYYALKKRFELEEKPWPWPPGSRLPVPRVEVVDIQRPVMPQEDTERMIAFAKRSGDSQVQAFVALSTTYGLRRAEMVRIKREDISENSNHHLELLVKTAKGGEQRKHLVPEEIKLYLINYNYKYVHENFMSRLFLWICASAGIEKQGRLGWHAIRRALVTSLLNRGVPMPTVMHFLRWRSREIALLYYRPDSRKADEVIFEKHPFLPFWK